MLVKLVKMAAEGKVFPEKTLSVLAPASAKQIERPATKLCVECPSQYPMQFPKSLQELKVNNCSLRRVSPQIIALPNLCVLDLSCNSIPDVPNAFGQLVNLHTIDLSNNKLTCFPIVLLKSELRNSLVSINLKHNEIKALPHDMSKLQNVHSLNLNNNLIQCLPESIAFIRSLQNIFMSDNKLGYLPGILLSRTLGTADFSHNLFVDRLRDRGSGLFSVPTLMEWAARVVVNQRIHYTNEDLDVHSISYLKQVHYCLCGKPCFESSISQLHRSKLPSTINYSSEEYPFLVYICSKKCQQRFDKL
ncbi:unnamed protein product [Lymnaea stagnalis]|uniref:Uncharacterized protein n=1 Tax=Lymnaea stagnalis TaxID=6523 RepID=A0AAV2I0C1_LYMST